MRNFEEELRYASVSWEGADGVMLDEAADRVAELELALNQIKQHIKIVNPTGYKMSGIYVLACKAMPDA